MSAYAAVHARLVRRTRAYQALYAELGELTHRLAPACRAAALVPSSTGEVLAEVGDCAAQWTAVDLDPACLAACRAVLPAIETIEANLGGHFPLPESSFDLVLSVHALHFLPSVEPVLVGFARALRPGGIAMIVTYARPEGVLATMRRVARAYGAGEAANLLAWKVADTAMLLGSRARYFEPETLSACVRDAGLDVVHTAPAFRGISTLLVARKPPI